MHVEIALIAAVIALITVAFSGYLVWSQLQQARVKWITEQKMACQLEVHKMRLVHYPAMSELIGKISTRHSDPLTADRARAVAVDINMWFYGAGGLVAGVSTRDALLGLREALLQWTKGPMPTEVREWRNATMYMLRRDLDLGWVDAYNSTDLHTLLQKVTAEIKPSNTRDT